MEAIKKKDNEAIKEAEEDLRKEESRLNMKKLQQNIKTLLDENVD